MVAPLYVPESADRLAEYREAAHEAGFWQARWARTDLARYLARYRDGHLGYFEGVFTRHLPRDRPILEAGCGRGQYVVALARRGYDVCGLEYAAETVDAIRAVEPGLNVEAGDLRRLPFPDGSFGAYISLGVVEHYREGPGEILREAHRVLGAGGVLLLSVPHYNPSLRRLMESRATPPRAAPPLSRDGQADFYQFYFSRAAIEALLASHGFEPADAFFYDSVYGAKRAFPRFLKLFEANRPFRAVVSRMNRFAFPQALLKRFSHMVMIVARRL